MHADWLHRIAPFPRPSLPHAPEESSFTGRSWHDKNWLEPRRVIYDHQLILVQKGEFRIEIEDRVFNCKEGTFLIIPPGKWETTWNVAPNRGRRCWCHFDWVYQGSWEHTPIMTYAPAKPRSALLRPAPEFMGNAILHGCILSPRVAFEFFERLLQRQILGDVREQLASRAILLELLLHLFDQGTAQAQLKKTHQIAESVRLRLKTAVESGRPIESVQKLLERSNYSYAHLCRLFRTAYGIAPIRYIHNLRIERAKLLLSETTLTISEIAYQVGLSDAGYFSRLFRKLTKHSPGQYLDSTRRQP